ncbi:MAG: alanine--tRNA ligase [Marinilabiliaceae bacterium]|nr:alanine--tRNA ligase [Marinilabiliaceae bacterium]
MTANEVRQSFLDFFASKGHKIVPSAPMVVKGDPTLMFTNAGMNQFKDVILGNAPIVNPRVADSQKCLRVSGKHNDLEEVGHDTYHHTMFEMLGNWSFGDYFKDEAIAFAWEYLTEVLKLDKDRLYVTIFEGSKEEGLERDVEAYESWKKHISEDRILNGNKHDNFWEMGDTGPCGPCSEIHFDMRPDEERNKINGRDLVNKDNPQVIEIWNNVFMQFNRKADHSLELLPNHHVDTGMGFERLVRAVQHKTSNYDTDVFTPILDEIGKITGFKYGESEQVDIAMRVVADHIRTIAFSITDGQQPSNNKAGYVIRRILRRAVRYYYTFLGQREATLYKLLPVLNETMGVAYPELIAQKELVSKVIKQEEESFLRTLATGISMLDKIMNETKQGGQSEVSGKVAFELYDTYGFPLDLTELILRENALTVNLKEFESEMQAQKDRARDAGKIETGDWVVLQENDKEDFVGYDVVEAEVRIMRYRKVKVKNKEQFQVVFNQTPFYGESGGQIGDTGYIESANETINVIQTIKENGLIIHIVDKFPDNPSVEFRAVVDASRRQLIANNHSATHLMQEALRQVLGEHVEQKGSYVTSESLRFDFSHFQKVTDEEIAEVERLVNKKIREDIALDEHRNVPINEAKALGAMALFGEKYGETVRVIKFGTSIELCGGTHTLSTGRIGLFKIVSESASSAGVRRIEAVTADSAERLMNENINMLKSLAELLKTTPANMQKSIEALVANNQKLEQQCEGMMDSMLSIERAALREKMESVGDVKLLVAEIKPMFVDRLKDLAFQLRNESDKIVCVLGCVAAEKPQIMTIMSDSLVADKSLNAVEAIRAIAKHIQGGGGGQPFFASAGGKNPAGLDAALREAKYYFQDKLK